MFPSSSKLFSGMTAAAGNVTKMTAPARSSTISTINEGEDGELLPKTGFEKKSAVVIINACNIDN
jgi:hypothetical protein